MDKIKQIVEIFKNENFETVFKKIKDKYIQLDRIGGKFTISKNKLSRKEQESLKRFLSLTKLNNKIAIDVNGFFDKLRRTHFGEISQEEKVEILHDYFNTNKIITKKDIQTKEKLKEEEFWEDIFNQIPNSTIGAKWFNNLLNNVNFINQKKTIKGYYNNSEVSNVELKESFVYVAKALNNLPLQQDSMAKLGCFSYQITGDPHFFDNDTSNNINGALLFHYALTYCFNIDKSFTTKGRYELLTMANLTKNSTSSIAMCSNMTAYKKNGQVHQGWLGDLKEKDYRRPTFEQLQNLGRIEVKHNKIYMFENPNVFTEVFNSVGQETALICGRGQVNTATYLLLEKIIRNNPKVEIYYSGDFDMGGLIIADNLKNNFKDNIKLWLYNKDIFNEYSGKETKNINIREISSIKDDKLIEVKKLIIDKEKIIYEEEFTGYIKGEIKRDKH